MNLPDIDWNTYSGHSSIADDFADLAYDLNLTQYVTGPTHHAGNTLDIALSNINSLRHIDTYTRLPPALSSDHYMITLLIECVLNKPTKIHKQRFDYNNANWEDINLFLSQYDFKLALNSNNPEFIWLKNSSK